MTTYSFATNQKNEYLCPGKDWPSIWGSNPSESLEWQSSDHTLQSHARFISPYPSTKGFSYRKIKGGVTMNIYENYVAKIIFDKIICWELSYGPGSRTWTDMVFPPRDFKSLASAYFAIPGYIIYKAVHHTPFTTAPYLIPILVYPGFH